MGGSTFYQLTRKLTRNLSSPISFGHATLFIDSSLLRRTGHHRCRLWMKLSTKKRRRKQHVAEGGAKKKEKKKRRRKKKRKKSEKKKEEEFLDFSSGSVWCTYLPLESISNALLSLTRCHRTEVLAPGPKGEIPIALLSLTITGQSGSGPDCMARFQLRAEVIHLERSSIPALSKLWRCCMGHFSQHENGGAGC